MKQYTLPLLVALLLLVGLGWYIDSVAHAQLVLTIRFAIYLITGVIIIFISGAALFLILIIRERMKGNRFTSETLTKKPLGAMLI